MKYEAKAQVDADDSIVADGGFSDSNNWGLATHSPVSVAEGRPWVKINQTNAIAECQSQGWDLISDQQWMVIAENILNTEINDLNASDNDTQLSNGRSSMPWNGGDNSADAELDPDLSDCNVGHSLDSSQNDNCTLRGSVGYSDTNGSWTDAYNPSGDGRSDLRMHMLSNGEVIWDLAGNVYQWTSSLINTGVYFEADGYYDSISIYSSHSDPYQFTPWMQPSQSRSNAYGFGYYYIYGDSGTYVGLRGGFWSDGDFAGVFYVDGYIAPSDAITFLGFRCVYEPN